MKVYKAPTEVFILETVDKILNEQYGNPQNAKAVLRYLAAIHANNQAKLRLEFAQEQLRRTMKDNGIGVIDT